MSINFSMHAWCVCVSLANDVSQVVGDSRGYCCGLECSPDKAVLGSVCVLEKVTYALSLQDPQQM